MKRLSLCTFCANRAICCPDSHEYRYQNLIPPMSTHHDHKKNCQNEKNGEYDGHVTVIPGTLSFTTFAHGDPLVAVQNVPFIPQKLVA